MLGCHGFPAQQDWTYDYVRRTLGDGAVAHFSADAVAADAQRHYGEAAARDGLAGVFRAWGASGDDERCDWTLTLDAAGNALRWDMRRCPSKLALLEADRHADADFCDRCVGWIAPALAPAGIDFVRHEHNHLGQCWGELRVRGVPHRPATPRFDVRDDAAWGAGPIDAFDSDGGAVRRLTPRAADEIRAALAHFDELLILGRGPSAAGVGPSSDRVGVLVADPTYATDDVFAGEPAAVLIGDRPRHLARVAERYLATPVDRRPPLLHAYLPSSLPVAFGEHGLPRPLPILPLLIEAGLYRHAPMSPHPTSGVFLTLVAAAIGKPTTVAGIDLYAHPSGATYASDAATSAWTWPERHSRACELAHLHAAASRLGGGLRIVGPTASVLG